MRGKDEVRGSLFSYVDLEQRIRADHPLRLIRTIVNAALAEMSAEFDALYPPTGRDSIPPERLLRALLLQAFYSIRSERQLVERIDFDLLFRWFVGLGVDDPVWDATTFTKNRDRLLAGDVAARFLATVLAQPRVRTLLSTEHFSVDGTLLEAWASTKSFRPKDGSGPPPDAGRNGEQDFRGQMVRQRDACVHDRSRCQAIPHGSGQGGQALLHGPRPDGEPQRPDRRCRRHPRLRPRRAAGRAAPDRASCRPPEQGHARRRQGLRHPRFRSTSPRTWRRIPAGDDPPSMGGPPAIRATPSASGSGSGSRRRSADLGRAVAVGCQQHDPGAPNVLLQTVAVLNNGAQPFPVAGGDMQADPGVHTPHSHIAPRRGKPFRTLPSGFVR